MKKIIVIIGSLCREHIICEKLKQHHPVIISNFLNNKIYENCFEYIIDTPLTNENIIKNILELQKEYEIDFVVMNQEKFIAQGLVDELDRINVKSVAPFKNVAKIESDKYFGRKLLNDNGLSHFNPDFKYFDSYNEQEIINYINKLNNYYVVKDTSLKGGKGVKVSSVHLKNIDEGLQFCKSIIEENGSFLIEEKLVGSEFSYHSFTDSKSVKHTFGIKDFKRLDDNNVGPNTGSMGCISGNLNFLDKNDILGSTVPGVMMPNVYHLYNINYKIKYRNDSKITVFSSNYKITNNNPKSIFSSKVKIFGYEFKKYSVIKIK